MDEIVEGALRKAALWDEVKDRLKTNAFGMSGGQQQRLCIARALAIEPDVILMDEPCSALDPISTAAIEDLMLELKERYSIVIVTHNMQQAARVSDRTAFFNVAKLEEGKRVGRLVEFAPTEKIFTNPDDERTKEYVTGQVRVAAVASTRCRRSPDRTASATSRSSRSSRSSVLGGIDLVLEQLDRVTGGARAPGRRARRDRHRRRRPHRRALPRGPPGDPVDARAARRRSPATCGSSPRCCTSSSTSSAWATSA